MKPPKQPPRSFWNIRMESSRKARDRKSTRLNSSHVENSYAVFCLKKKKPHTLRHSFATHMLEQGVNIKLIQRILGHTTLKTTSVYLHLTNIDLTKVKSPLENMNV